MTDKPKTRIEWRDGKRFVVTILPDVERPTEQRRHLRAHKGIKGGPHKAAKRKLFGG